MLKPDCALMVLVVLEVLMVDHPHHQLLKIFSTQRQNFCFLKVGFFFSVCVIYMFTGGTLVQPESKHCSDTFTQAHANKFYCNTLEIHGNHTLKVIESLKRRDVLRMHNHVCIMLLSVETTDRLCIKFIFSSATTQ